MQESVHICGLARRQWPEQSSWCRHACTLLSLSCGRSLERQQQGVPLPQEFMAIGVSVGESLMKTRCAGLRDAAARGGGAHLGPRAPQRQAADHQRGGHAPLLQEAGLPPGGAIHGQGPAPGAQAGQRQAATQGAQAAGRVVCACVLWNG